MLEKLSATLSKGVESIREAFKEAALNLINESPLRSSMEVIENTSLKSFQGQNEVVAEKINVEKSERIERNRFEGAHREELAYQELRCEFPEKEGYKIEKEQYLRDKDGNIVKDVETGNARRIDFTVTKDGQSVKSIEVTSETAPKDAQIAKEGRIRDSGGNFIKDRDTGHVIPMSKTQTEVRRYA